jgi:hypothetical protein
MNREPRGRASRVLTGVGIILLTSLGSVLAANIAIGNSNKAAEFGQGTYTMKACDTWIQLNLVSGPTGQYGAPAGLSALTGITVQELMPTQCPSTKFTVRALDSSAKILPLYRTDQNTTLCSSKPYCVIGKNSESDLILVVSSGGVVSLFNPDVYHQLAYNSSTGIYTFTFTQPGQLAQSISTVTIQSSVA